MSRLVFRNLRYAPPAEIQTHVPALSWRVFETSHGSVHLALLLEGGTLRVTSAIRSVSRSKMDFVTESGRVYRLYGPPESSAELIQAFGLMTIKVAGVTVADVSDRFWAGIIDPAGEQSDLPLRNEVAT